MNLIVNRQLDRQEELAIYELTLKKQRSKKKTNVDAKHAAAMQRLADELFQERKQQVKSLDEHRLNSMSTNGLIPLSERDQTLCRCHSAIDSSRPITSSRSMNALDANKTEKSLREKQGDSDDDFEKVESSDLIDATTQQEFSLKQLCDPSRPKAQTELQRQSSTSTIATDSSCSTNNSRHSSSASSHGLSSNNDLMQLHHCPSSASSLQLKVARQQLAQKLPTKSISFLSSARSDASSSSSANILLGAGVIPDETNIKLNQLRLEQLNNELERRLHQYEYLVAQEKAILGTYNLNLFTNEGVNNFQRYEMNQQRKLHGSQSCSNMLQFSSQQSRKGF